MTRILDWRSRHDPASLNYPIRALLPKAVKRRRRMWAPGQILDQGQEGACVGHGFTDEATASPVRVDFARTDFGPEWPKDAQAFAFALYEWCKKNDEYPGEDYDGTSVLTGAKGMKMLGLIREYRWALSVDDLIDTLCAHGPVVLGIPWLEGMYDAPHGELDATGKVVGGHCILAAGYDPAHQFSNGEVAEAIALVNSWGPSWGVNGVAWIRVYGRAGLAPLLKQQGEMCVPVRRSYGRKPSRVKKALAALSRVGNCLRSAPSAS